MPLMEVEFDPNDLYVNDKVDSKNPSEIHHIIPIAVGKESGPIGHAQSNKLKNLQLLHKECHFEITSNSLNHAGELSAVRTAR